MGVGDQRHAPAALLPGKTRYPLYRRLGGPQGRSGQVRKISPPPGFDPRTVQPVVGRYTDYVIAAHIVRYEGANIICYDCTCIFARLANCNYSRKFRKCPAPRGLNFANCEMFSYMYVRLHVKWVLPSSGFNQTWISSTGFSKHPQSNVSWKRS
jgi:hypothetical protein